MLDIIGAFQKKIDFRGGGGESNGLGSKSHLIIGKKNPKKCGKMLDILGAFVRKKDFRGGGGGGIKITLDYRPRNSKKVATFSIL